MELERGAATTPSLGSRRLDNRHSPDCLKYYPVGLGEPRLLQVGKTRELDHRRRSAHDDLGVGADGRQVLLEHGLVDEP